MSSRHPIKMPNHLQKCKSRCYSMMVSVTGCRTGWVCLVTGTYQYREFILSLRQDGLCQSEKSARILTQPFLHGKLSPAFVWKNWSRGVAAKHAALSRPRSRVRIPSGPLSATQMNRSKRSVLLLFSANFFS